MADKREQILSRLLVVCSGVTGILAAYRNHDEISDTAKPCILILDADELAAEGDPQRTPNRRLVTMTPEIYVMLNDAPADVGTQLNTFRARTLSAIFGDATLQGYTVNQNGIRYDGCATGLARGRQMEGSIGLAISFTYVLNIADL